MNTTNDVVFKGNKTGINIVLNNSVEFDIIKNVLLAKTIDASNFFGKTKTAITFSGRELTDNEEMELVNIITQASDLDISFVESNNGKEVYVQKTANKNLDIPTLISAEENNTIFHRGSLRSGQSIKYSGSVVIFGDINPGAEVIAHGNIIIMGSLKGFVHAGSTGNSKCLVAALNMIPTQMRIGEVITYIPEKMAKENKNIPSYAYVENGQIYIVPINN